MSMGGHRRILLVSPMYPFRGGIAHLSESIAKGFLDRGCQVEAVTFTRQYPKLLFPGKTQYETNPVSDQVVKAKRLIDSLNPFSWFKAAKYIRDIEPDVVIFRYWLPFFAPAFGTIARQLARSNIKCVVVVDNALPHKRGMGDIVLGRYFFKVVQGCVVMSSSVGQDVDLLNPSCPRAFAPHPLYDTFGKPANRGQARKKLQMDPDAPIILFFGFIRKYKGLHVLIESMREVLKVLPNICLLVAGEFYEDKIRCQDMIKEFDLSEHIIFFDWYIPKDEVADYFAATDVVVQPYLSATQSGVAQVAYHFEVPIITTNVGGLAEAIPHEKAGLIVPPNDASALAKAIIRYFSESMKNRLTQGVQRQKQSFGWGRLLDAIESMM